MKQHILYIPGLGDGNNIFRRIGLVLWRGNNTSASLVSMRWSDKNESFEDKLLRIRREIDRHPNKIIHLVGESAGGAVSLVAFKRFSDKVSRVTTICGMNQGADTVNSTYYQKNPAFHDAMVAVDAALPTLTDDQKAKIKTIYSTGDSTVRPHHTLIAGVESQDISIKGHMRSILTVLFMRYGQVVVDKT